MPDVTVRQLAVLCGVSRTTISLALRNHPRIPEPTRRKIQAMAAAKGYRQDPVVSSLMNKLRTSRVRRTAEKIAFLTTWQPFEGWESEQINTGLYLRGMRRRAFQLGYEVEHIWSGEPGMTSKRLSRILYTRAIKGVIIAPLFEASGRFRLEWEHFAAATTGFSLVDPDLHRTAHGHYMGMQLALRELGRLGYRRIGYATKSDQDERVNQNWLGALLAHQHSHPTEDRVPPLLVERMEGDALKKWIQKHRPDAVISNWPTVPGLMRDAGFDVPGDIGFASLDLFPGRQAFAAVDQIPEKVGAAAAGMVVKQIQNNEFGLPKHPVTMQLNGVWRDGPTVKKQRGKRGA